MTFEEGETGMQVSLMVTDDEWVETVEEFTLSLNPVDERLLRSQALFTINDDDCKWMSKMNEHTFSEYFYTD